jgi:molybdopterin molybdotransferase
LAVDDAVDRVLAAIRPLDAETTLLAEAHGRVLAEDVTAEADVPPSDNSAMDGYAIRAADTPGTLRVIGPSRRQAAVARRERGHGGPHHDRRGHSPWR